ncbi:MAG: molybdate ABC transporter substrate-binding protein [Armatimonadetes bacterium]|nr:molybdate ABC transporter substrate-binding protein [Armatimonadota bacterium]MDW8122772.1 molybdate ABC transporter substrate-binding protein [Armatimonadota bacterium]
MRRFLMILGALALTLFILSGAWAQRRKELRVFAGAANMPPLTEAAKLYEKKYGVKVWLTFGGSGVVLSQMKLARKGDVYVPGSDDYMEKALKEKVVDPKSVRIICWLIPVINVPKGNPKKIQSLEDLTRPGLRVAIARPGSVCLGDVAVEILQKSGLYDAVRKNIVTEGKDCADLAALLKLGTVDAIIGWDVFSYWYPDTPLDAIPFPAHLLRFRHIPAGVSVFASDKKEAQRFVNFLASGLGKNCYAKCGYSINPPKVTAEKEKSGPKKVQD